MSVHSQDSSNGRPDHRTRFVKFGAVGIVNTIADFAVYAAVLALGASPVFANIISFLTANIQSYILNARFTFREKGAGADVSLTGYGRFLLAHTAGLVLSTAVIIFLAEPLGPYFAKLIAIAASVTFNYAMTAIFVFRRPS